MIADSVESCFPDGIRLPDAIRCICDFLDANGYPISGCFEINTRGDDAASWFPNDTEMQRQIAVFGNGSTGSTYALWLTHSPDPANAPVVLLGSEGDLKVLAESPVEFCRLLGCGYDELEWDDLSTAPTCFDETASFREWIADKLGLDFPATGDSIAQRAAERFPGFSDWVTVWQNGNL